MTDQQRIESALRLSRILFTAMLASTLVYVGIAFALVRLRDPAAPIPQPTLASAPLTNPLFLALAGMAAVMLVITPIVRARVLPARGSGPAKQALAKIRAADILSWALTEVIAIFGLILTFLSYELVFVLGFAGVSAVAMLAYAPSRARVEELVHRARG